MVGLVASAAAALVAALPAAGKNGVEATLRTAIPLDAPAGTQLELAWTLSYVDHGQRKPFDWSAIWGLKLSAWATTSGITETEIPSGCPTSSASWVSGKA